MQNENLTGDQVAQMPPSPPVQVQRGLTTSSGQFTAIFSLVALILSFLGLHYSSDQIENTMVVINNVIITLGPLFATIPVIITYINSRGKIASNAIVTQGKVAASVQAGPTAASLFQDPAQFAGIPGVGSFKDPHSYAVLLDIARAIGVPEADRLKGMNDRFHAEDIASTIISWFHKNKTPGA